MKKLRKIGEVLVMVLAIAAIFTSCKKEPSASFTYSPENPVQYDVVTFTNTSSDADSYLWEIGSGTSTDASLEVRLLDAGDYIVKLTATGEGGSQTIEKTVTVAPFDNHYMLDATKHTITTDFFWYQSSMGGDPYLRLLTDVAGQDNPDLLKLYPNKGLNELPGTYTWSLSGDAGTYDHGYTANYAGFNYDWTAIGKSGGDLVIEELVDGIYKISGEMVLSIGTFDWGTGEFTETSSKTLTIDYVGAITPLAK